MSAGHSSLEEKAKEFLKKKAEYDKGKKKSKILELLMKGLELLIKAATKYVEKQLKK